MARKSSRDQEPGYGSQEQTPGFAEALGRTIKVLRTDLGIERRELAERAGISYSYLTEIENGNKPPSSSVLAPIAQALGLRMYQLTEAAEARMDARLSEELASHGTAASEALGARAPEETLHQLRLGATAASTNVSARDWALQPSLRGPNRELRAVMIELERLLRRMAPDDIERLMDFARRLSR